MEGLRPAAGSARRHRSASPGEDGCPPPRWHPGINKATLPTIWDVQDVNHGATAILPLLGWNGHTAQGEEGQLLEHGSRTELMKAMHLLMNKGFLLAKSYRNAHRLRL